MQDLAVLVLGEIHRPLSDFTFPHASIQLTTRTVVVVVHRLFRVALEHFGRIRTVALGGSGSLAEVDDVLDVHCCYLPVIAARLVDEPKVYVY
ncbi:hypothetical protein D3C78_1690210 [compost metagenome]